MRSETKREPVLASECLAAARTCAALLLMFGVASAPALAQTPAAETTPSPPPAGTGTPPSSQGAADALGNWVQQSSHLMQQSGQFMQQGVATMGAGLGQMVGAIGGQANQATRDAADAARNAANSVSKLPNTGITAGHERCVIAPNGAPDCRGAAENLCRAKGYAGGNSVDFVTVENCPPPWRTSRRDAPEGACTMEHYVTKALCQ